MDYVVFGIQNRFYVVYESKPFGLELGMNVRVFAHDNARTWQCKNSVFKPAESQIGRAFKFNWLDKLAALDCLAGNTVWAVRARCKLL